MGSSRGMYTLQLQVSDGTQWSAPDVVMINIGDVAQNNRPIANAGDNQVVNVSANCESTTSYSVGSCSDCPETSFELSAAESIDPNGDTMYYHGARLRELWQALVALLYPLLLLLPG